MSLFDTIFTAIFGEPDPGIQQSDVSYTDGSVDCPRCGYDDPDVIRMHGTRRLDCFNCGYERFIEDGVTLYDE
jgi:ribosomal protein S27AE